MELTTRIRKMTTVKMRLCRALTFSTSALNGTCLMLQNLVASHMYYYKVTLTGVEKVSISR